MKRLLPFWALLQISSLASAQERLIDIGPNDRIEALNAVFSFRTDLSGDSTLIARCSIPGIDPDSGDVPGLEARFQRLLVRPDTALLPRPLRCAVMGFADPKVRVLYVERLVEVTKTASPRGSFSAWQSKQFEISFQLLEGPSYRSFHRYIVEPNGVSPVPHPDNPKDLTVSAYGWRVTEYKLMGWDFHWGDNLGHGSGVRRP